ncbi:tRNA pseudouridine(13) synthase TruD [Streptomyces sparsus]
MPPCVLKATPEDFVVTECLGLDAVPPEDADHQFLLLRKRGYTTHEAVAAIAEHLAVDPSAVAAAGLKDEDGVTEQYVSLRGSATPRQLGELNSAHRTGDAYLRVSSHGWGRAPLAVGDLDGNCFRVVARDLSPELAEALRAGPARRSLFFVNYYDTQRFGVPGGPKQTHLLGAALLAGDEQAAFALLRASGSAEGRRASAHQGDARSFLASLDPRVRAFYQCSDASYRWNEEVRQLVTGADGTSGAETAEVNRSGLRYVFPLTERATLAVLANCPALECGRYRWVGGEMRAERAPRPTVVQTQVRIRDVRSDEVFPGRSACSLSFFLPSGCYATNAIDQFFVQLEQAVRTTSSAARPLAAGV